MTQVTSGIRAILSVPIIYSSFQYLMGARSIWQYIANELMQLQPGDKVLDIGCGPADLLAFLPEGTCYWGFDISQEYIKSARVKYGDKGNFNAKLLEKSDLAQLPKFNKVILTGVFHHLDDEVAFRIIELAYMALEDEGQMISIDPCYQDGQSPIARFLISKDRGQNVREETSYRKLASKSFKQIKSIVRHRAWIPYTHCYMVCTK